MTLWKTSLLAQVLLYADDAKCARVINDFNDCYTLQNDLTAIYDWSKLWEMNFNLQKYKQLCITRKKNLFTISIILAWKVYLYD